MGRDRSSRDEQPLADLPIGQAGCREVGHLALSGRETRPTECRPWWRAPDRPYAQMTQDPLNPIDVADRTEALVAHDGVAQHRDRIARRAEPTQRHAGVL